MTTEKRAYRYIAEVGAVRAHAEAIVAPRSAYWMTVVRLVEAGWRRADSVQSITRRAV